MGEKALEHAGFRGRISSSVVYICQCSHFSYRDAEDSLDVLTGVASEYLLNVERMIQLLSDKYENKMSPEVGIDYVVKFRGSIILNPFLRELSRKCMYVL